MRLFTAKVKNDGRESTLILYSTLCGGVLMYCTLERDETLLRSGVRALRYRTGRAINGILGEHVLYWKYYHGVVELASKGWDAGR